MRSVKSHKALLLEEVIRLAYGLIVSGFKLLRNGRTSNAHVYTNARIACQGIPETLFITFVDMHIFMFDENASGSQGKCTLTSFQALVVHKCVCLRIRSEVFFRIADSKYIVVIVELLIIESCVVLCR